MIDCAECIPEIIRLKAQFAVLKIGMLRYQRLIEVFYGKREPEFSINSKEW